MVDKLSELPRRAPTAGMSTDDLLKQAYADEFAKAQVGAMVRRHYLQSLGRSAQFAQAGVQEPQALQASARQPMPENNVGGPEDALGSFNIAIEGADKMTNLMRNLYEAQKPGWDDYLKQVAMGALPRLIGM